VASCPCDERNLHFHLRRSAGDAFAERVFGGLRGTDTVRVEGPFGDFVLREKSQRPLVFLACDSGFAPVKSLIEHAMALDAAETLQLVWIASGAGGHYLDNLCRSWGDALDNFRYHPIATPGGVPDGRALQAALQQVLQMHPRLDECDVYVAAPEPWADAVASRLIENGLPRAQLAVSRLKA
jgi:CDP-4-dehydro-6-deoxyglucose reductase